eukprot:m.344163 g.344163  ORF g.344163 m.344163 type:complete len:408 (+) comp16134_c0_seq4:2826-4049(+)
MSERFKKLYTCHQPVSINESLSPLVSRVGFKQYSPQKRKRFGVKVWALVDSVSTYLKWFDIYQGAGTSMRQGLGLGGSVIYEMLEKAEMLNKNHVVICDRFFTSTQLALQLLERQTHLVGTVRSNRHRYPSKRLKFARKAARGSTKHVKTTSAPLLYAMNYQDRKPVLMLASINPSRDPRFRKRTVVRRRAKQSALHIPSPTIRNFYNTYMGGVDRVDQCRNYGMIRIKQLRRYYLQIMFYVLDAVIHNARVLYNETRSTEAEQLPTIEFRKQLVRELCPHVFDGSPVFAAEGEHASQSQTTQPQATQTDDISLRIHPDTSFDHEHTNSHMACPVMHQTTVSATPTHTTHHTPVYMKRRVCTHCKNKSKTVSIGCHGCGVSLHIPSGTDPTNVTTSCWSKYHTCETT